MSIDPSSFSDLPLLELFRLEVETQSAILTNGLLELERQSDSAHHLEVLMRAAHSLKGASRIVDRKSAVRIAHAMEECFVSAKKQEHALSGRVIDSLLKGVDFLNRIARVSDQEFHSWEANQRNDIDSFLASLSSLAQAVDQPLELSPEPLAPAVVQSEPVVVHLDPIPAVFKNTQDERTTTDRIVRVTAENLNRLMGLAGEGLVASRWFETFSADLLRVKRLNRELGESVEEMRDWFTMASVGPRESERLAELRGRVNRCKELLGDRLSELERFDQRFVSFSTRLYHEVLDCRMRPFTDGIKGFQRMVRDVARSLNKKVRLEVKGEATLVDRDILERLKAPLDHLLRNAIDHGIEAPADRRAQGKLEEGTVELQAAHSAGMLLVTLSDDGRGVDADAIRAAVVRKGLTTPKTTEQMSETELHEFLFLPGFTLKESVSEISGRGVGLDAVQAMAKEVGGRVRVSSRKGCGARFQLELPLTLSVVRTLLAEIAGEPYAFPLARIDRALKVSLDEVHTVQGRQHFALDDEQIGLVTAHQVLELEKLPAGSGDACVVVLGGSASRFGLVVDRFLGERELVVRTLDSRLGKVRNFSSAALMTDGSPVLIVDVDDLIRSIENLVSGQRIDNLGPENRPESAATKKRVLVVDDSLTVRELERKLLQSRGYAVDIAVDGMDGWNAVRTGHYDLVVTDVDMPRLDGIELLNLIRRDSRLKPTPVMIVSYKDRQEDRDRGLEAGADYYLTKASFHDETLLRVVSDLIGGANS